MGAWAVILLPYFFLLSLIMSIIRAITAVIIVTNKNIPSYVTIVITPPFARRATVRRAAYSIVYGITFFITVSR